MQSVDMGHTPHQEGAVIPWYAALKDVSVARITSFVQECQMEPNADTAAGTMIPCVKVKHVLTKCVPQPSRQISNLAMKTVTVLAKFVGPALIHPQVGAATHKSAVQVGRLRVTTTSALVCQAEQSVVILPLNEMTCVQIDDWR